jgi:phage baseplate assembly protein gpV
MSTSPHETPSESSDDAPVTAERIAAFERDDGAVVIYDEREHTAWIQSSGAVDVEEAR